MPESKDRKEVNPSVSKIQRLIKSIIDKTHPLIVFCYRLTGLIFIIMTICMFVVGPEITKLITNFKIAIINFIFFVLYMLQGMYYERQDKEQ